MDEKGWDYDPFVGQEFNMIRFIVGLVIVMGAVGGMDAPENSLLVLMGIAGLGLALMYLGSEKMKQM